MLPHLQQAIEARKKAKMDYDHYYFKVEELQSKPNTDPNKMVRVLASSLILDSRTKTSARSARPR